jgi:flavin-dependent dehydrogenase
MRVAIAGAGMAGSYAYRLLARRGRDEVDIFDVRHRIACGIHPDGFGVDDRFDDLVRHAGLEPSSYVIHVPPRFVAHVEGVAAKTTVFMIDKPRLIRDLLGGAEVRYEPVDVGRYDLVVDATGAARAYSPPLENDLKARVVQWRVRVRAPVATAFMPTRGVAGYAWIMPLSEDGTEVHVGAGCRVGVAASAKSLTRPAFRSLDVAEVICACGGRIRLSGPDFGRLVHGNVWAVGEAAGLVGPASGAGNVYAMHSALLLVNNLGNGRAYTSELEREYSALVPEARAVRKIVMGRWPSPVDLLHIRRGWARAGVHVGWLDLPRLVVAMGRAYLQPGI